MEEASRDIDEYIADFYDKATQRLTIEKQQLQAQRSKCTKEKLPPFTYNMVRNQIDKVYQGLNMKLLYVRRRWRDNFVNWSFDEGICSVYFEIQNDGKRVVKQRKWDYRAYLAPILPSVEIDETLKKLELKLKKFQEWGCIGLAHSDTIQTLQTGFSIKFPKGVYYVHATGSNSNHEVLSQDQKAKANFCCSSGDVVAIEVDLVQCKVTVQNKTKGPYFQTSLSFKREQGNPLFIFVMMWGQKDEVQILSVP